MKPEENIFGHLHALTNRLTGYHKGIDGKAHIYLKVELRHVEHILMNLCELDEFASYKEAIIRDLKRIDNAIDPASPFSKIAEFIGYEEAKQLKSPIESTAKSMKEKLEKDPNHGN